MWHLIGLINKNLNNSLKKLDLNVNSCIEMQNTVILNTYRIDPNFFSSGS